LPGEGVAFFFSPGDFFRGGGKGVSRGVEVASGENQLDIFSTKLVRRGGGGYGGGVVAWQDLSRSRKREGAQRIDAADQRTTESVGDPKKERGIGT